MLECPFVMGSTGDFRPFISGEEVPWHVYKNEDGYEYLESPIWEQPVSWWLEEFQDKGDAGDLLGNRRQTLLVGIDGGREIWQDVRIPFSPYEGIQVTTEKRSYLATEYEDVPSTRKVGTELIAHKGAYGKTPRTRTGKRRSSTHGKAASRTRGSPPPLPRLPGGPEPRPGTPPTFRLASMTALWQRHGASCRTSSARA